MKQRTNEEQLELFADLLEPAAEILGDEEIAKVFKGGGKAVTAVKMAIKNHKAAVVALLAALDGESAETYVVPAPPILAVKLLNFLNDPDLQQLFTSPGQKNVAASFGSDTESTEDGAN